VRKEKVRLHLADERKKKKKKRDGFLPRKDTDHADVGWMKKIISRSSNYRGRGRKTVSQREGIEKGTKHYGWGGKESNY